MKKLKIIAIYRGRFLENRGTPIRVRSLLTNLEKKSDIDLTVFSWDKEQDIFAKHFYMSNNHVQDVRALLNYVRKNHVDVVIGHTVATSYYLAVLKLFTKAKIVLEMHGIIELEAKEYGDISTLKYYFLRIWHSIFYVMCDMITTCSKSITDIVGRHNKHAFTMCGGADIAHFNPNVERGKYIKRDERIVVGYAGNARIWQGVDFLISEFKKFLLDHRDYRLVILSSEKKGFCQELEVFGPLDNHEVPKFLIDCDVLVIPRLETPVTKISFPSKLPEYMAMGKAVLAADTGDVRDIITSGVNGQLYAPGSKEEFALRLLELRDKVFRDKLGQGALHTAQTLSWDRLSGFLLDKIREIA